VETSPDAIVLRDLSGKLVWANQQAAEIVGCKSPEELIGRTGGELVVSEDRERVEDRTEKTLRFESLGPTEFTIPRTDGTSVVVESRSALVPDAQGKPKVIMAVSRDITERKLAENALREEKARLSSIFRASPIGIGVVIDRVFVDVNDHFCELLGFDRDELLGENARMVYPSDEDYEYVGREKYRQIDDNGVGSVETRMQRKDGKVVNVLLSSTPLNPADISQGVTFTVLDITERKKAERDLRESEERFRSLFEFAPDGFYLNDIEGNLIDGNKVAEEITGFSKEELVGENFLQLGLLSEDYLPKAAELLAKNAAGLPTGPDQFVLNRKDGTEVSVEIVTLPLLLGGENVVLGIARDVSARKKAEGALEESEKRYRTLAENASDVIWMMDMNLKMTYVSPSVERNSGYTPEEFMAKGLQELMTPESLEIAMQMFREELERESEEDRDPARSRILELEMIAKDGTSAWTEGSVTFIRDANGRVIGILGASRDISERKQAENELRESEEKLRSFIENFCGVAFRGRIYAKPFFIKGAVEEITGYTEEELIGEQPRWDQLRRICLTW
jgi:PAS domain S-box-containing protein